MKLSNLSKAYKLDEKDKNWYLLNAENKTLGRISTEISNILRGKNKPTFTPNYDNGDYVVVINAEKVKLSGNKVNDKTYYKDTKYIGGLKQKKASDLLEKDPEKIIYFSVKRMLPKTKLANSIIKKLKIYKGDNHPHNAQNPKLIEEL